MKNNLPALRAYAVTRTLSQPVDLATAIQTLGFVQIDPIRAPARAQDLILRHRDKKPPDVRFARELGREIEALSRSLAL